MSHKDDELSELLKPLKKLSPDDLQMRTWQAAVQSEARASRETITTTKSKWAFQLVAAVFVGFVMGALLVKSLLAPTATSSLVAQVSVDDATFEYSHTNLD